MGGRRGEADQQGGTVQLSRSGANMARIRQSRPDYGLVLRVKVRKTFGGAPSSRGSERE